jgi:hypothetical protein
MHLLQELGSQREIFLENHFEVNTIDPWMAFYEACPGQSAFFYTCKEVGIRGFALYLPERLPDQIDGKVEDNLEESFLTAEVLEKRTFCYPYVLDHAVDARLAKPVLGELVDGGIQDLVLLGFIKVIEPIAWKHTIFSGENDQVVIINIRGMLSNRKRGMRDERPRQDGRFLVHGTRNVRNALLLSNLNRYGIFDITGVLIRGVRRKCILFGTQGISGLLCLHLRISSRFWYRISRTAGASARP